MNDRGRRLRDLFRERVLCLDGAMGTMLQRADLGPADFGGPDLEGCNENLVLTRPGVVRGIHDAYLAAGADIVETNSFGGTPLVLGEYGLQDRAREINRAAAALARAACDAAGADRFVAGSMGPTTRSLSVTGGVTFDRLVDDYRIQAAGLLEGGADFLLLETAQDGRNLKAGLLGIRRAFAETGLEAPISVSATIEPMGTMLAGQAVDALAAAMEHADLLSIGLNCATGPAFMADHLRTLAHLARVPVTCYPNAGLPDEEGRYTETPEAMAAVLRRYLEHGWLNAIGGCCGTDPSYIRAFSALAREAKPRVPPHARRTHVSGIDYVACEEDNRPLLVGERTNVLGSRKFKELIAKGKWEEAAEIGRRQVKNGAQVLDVCLQDPDRDEAADVDRFLEKLVRAVKAPLMIDTTDAKVFELALRWCQGKSILNSVNLEDGEKRFEAVAPLARTYGAALVVGCIDEQGQAITLERKVEVAARSLELLTGKYGIPAEDILWDPLVFPCASGDKNYAGSAKHTIDAVHELKRRFPGTRTVLGISNVSFGVPAAGREVLNSVFLHHATKAGLDFAIVSSEKLVRHASIPAAEKALCDDVLFGRGDDPIAAFAAHFRGKKAAAPSLEKLSVDEILSRCIVEGTKEGLVAALEEKRRTTAPLDIINGPLMKGMDEVGRLFNANELIVAEVLQSAEAMKAAVSHLEPFMEKADAAARGTVLLATVKGDVHDIGKNLVEIILANNGYRVVNLGIKVDPATLVAAARREQPDVIGLSGLLVKSAQQMVATVEDFRTAGLALPVIVGGAALTRKFTYSKIRPAYGATVVYAKEAMQGLDLVGRLVDPAKRPVLEADIAREAAALAAPAPAAEARPAAPSTGIRSSLVDAEEPARRPPDFARHVERIDDASVLWPYLNLQMLYSKHLGLKGSVERLAAQRDPKLAELERIVADVQGRGWLKPRAAWRWFPASSEGDALLVYDEYGLAEIERFVFPRQPVKDGLCISDWVKPLDSGERDSVAMFVVSCGEGVRARAEELKQRGEYVLSHALQALALESAEAYAELLHERIRDAWGIGDPPGLPMADRLKARYHGRRVSFGYPACPDLADQEKLFRLLDPADLGVKLTDGHMMDPEASVSALVFHHRQATYFGLNVAPAE